MGLGLTNGGGGSFEARPYISYDARAGRFAAIERVQGSAGWEKKSTDITQGFAMVFDLETIDVGWIHFSGQGPLRTLVRLGDPIPAKPSEDHRQGFLVSTYNKALGEREFSSTAGIVVAAMDELYDAYKAAPEAATGQLPVVVLQSVKVVESFFKNKDGQMQKTSNYQPVFQIAKWVPRPEALKQKPTASAAPPVTAAPRAAQPVPPPAPVAAPPPAAQTAPAALNADDFG